MSDTTNILIIFRGLVISERLSNLLRGEAS